MTKTKTRIMKLEILVTGNSNTNEVKDLISNTLNKDWMGVSHVDFRLIQTCFEDGNYFNVAVYFENTNKELFYKYSCKLTAYLEHALCNFKNKKEAAIIDAWSTTL